MRQFTTHCILCGKEVVDICAPRDECEQEWSCRFCYAHPHVFHNILKADDQTYFNAMFYTTPNNKLREYLNYRTTWLLVGKKETLDTGT